MIVVGMSLLAIISAAVGCAAVRRCKLFSEISSPQEAAAFIALGPSQYFLMLTIITEIKGFDDYWQVWVFA
jgi:hypothetical protein